MLSPHQERAENLSALAGTMYLAKIVPGQAVEAGTGAGQPVNETCSNQRGILWDFMMI